MPSLTTPAVAAGQLAALGQPTLTAGDLTIRPWLADDAEAVSEAYADPGIQRWHVRSMASLDEAAEWIAAGAGRWQAETGADWAVVRDGVVAGRVGINRLELWDGLGALAYWVVLRCRGHAVAPRAVTAVSDWALTTAGLHRLHLTHSTANPASCRVAVKAGFELEGTLRGQGYHADGWHDMHLHARLAP